MRNESLVIGYGNTLRGDDGVGQKVAEVIASLGLSGIRALSCHQLTPELADPISEVRMVVFVDATVDNIALAKHFIADRKVRRIVGIDLTRVDADFCPRLQSASRRP